MIGQDGSKNLFRKLLGYFEVGDFDSIEGLLAPDAEFQFPFGADSAPLVGRDRIVEYLRVEMAGFVKSMKFDVEREFECADPAWTIAEYSSVGVLRSGGRYENRYVGLLQARNGKVAIFREYFNPVRIAEAAGTGASSASSTRSE
jgi:ketosteroid isomerase-like protein